MSLAFQPRHPSWPAPPKMRRRKEGEMLQLTLLLSPAHLLALCSLIAEGAKAPIEQLVGLRADETDRKLMELTRADLMVLVQRLAGMVLVEKRQAELQQAREMEPIESNQP